MSRLYLPLSMFVLVLVAACSASPNEDELVLTIEAGIAMTSTAIIAPTETATSVAQVSIEPEPEVDLLVSPTPEVSIVPYVSLVPISYTLEDTGGGWNAGMVEFAIANTTDDIIRPEARIIEEVVVETSEGVTYQAQLQTLDTDTVAGWRSGDYFDLDAEPILPDTQFSRWRGSIHFAAAWRSASAATPTKIIIRTRGYGLPQEAEVFPDISVVLPAQGSVPVSYPLIDGSTLINSVNSLNGKAMPLSGSQLEATFTGECWFLVETYSDRHSYFFDFDIKNNDDFQEGVGEILPKVVVYTNDGQYFYIEVSAATFFGDSQGVDTSRPPVIVMGPAQSGVGSLYVGGVDVSGYDMEIFSGLLWPDGSHDLYDLSSCLSREIR